MQTFQIVAGFLVIALTFLDFFHTTLSGNGFGFVSRAVNRNLNKILLHNRTRFWFKYSGLIHLLTTTFIWLCLLFLGTYMIFTSGDFMVISSIPGVPANQAERFYFTGYLLSTLGIGDFVPGNRTSMIIAGILSFSGFILITTGMTYLLSVVSAVLKKKQLAFFIASLGGDVGEMYGFFKQQEKLSSLVSDANQLRQQILGNASNYLSFPVVAYFLSRDPNTALIVQLGRLYEVLNVLKQDWDKNTLQYIKIQSILSAIEKYLDLGLRDARSFPANQDKVKTLRSYWKGIGYSIEADKKNEERLSSSLKISGWDWEDIYTLQEPKGA